MAESKIINFALNSNTLKSVTSVASGVTVTGGYIQFGRIVIVNIQISASSSINAYTNLCLLPKPTKAVALPSANTSTGQSDNLFYIQDEGYLRDYYGLSSGKTLVVSGAYIAYSA